MARAEDLFHRLQSQGLIALDRLIEDREPESLFLDFKGTRDSGTGKGLLADDNKNLSKAISGFGNSAGGILIWGVDCRKDPTTGNEIPQKQPVPDAAALRGRMEGAVSRCTIPPHPNVQTHWFEATPGNPAGFVAVLIPQSLNGPLRSTVSGKYHFRSGSDFQEVPHEVLAGMFGRAPQPVFSPNYILAPATISDVPGGATYSWLRLELRIVGMNLGAVIAERPYLSIWLNDFPRDRFQWECANPADYQTRGGQLPGFSMVAKPGVSIAPNAAEDMCMMAFLIRSDQLNDVNVQVILAPK